MVTKGDILAGQPIPVTAATGLPQLVTILRSQVLDVRGSQDPDYPTLEAALQRFHPHGLGFFSTIFFLNMAKFCKVFMTKMSCPPKNNPKKVTKTAQGQTFRGTFVWSCFTPPPERGACFGGSATGVLEDLITCRQDRFTVLLIPLSKFCGCTVVFPHGNQYEMCVNWLNISCISIYVIQIRCSLRSSPWSWLLKHICRLEFFVTWSHQDIGTQIQDGGVLKLRDH